MAGLSCECEPPLSSAELTVPKTACCQFQVHHIPDLQLRYKRSVAAVQSPHIYRPG